MNWNFLKNFLNKEISFNILLICLTFSIHEDEGHFGEACLNSFYLGPRFHVIKSRK